MSIQSQLERIQDNIADAYSAVDEKGGQVPEKSNSSNLGAAIRSIPGGGEVKNGVTFIPSVSEAGIISWKNDGGLPNPDPVNIKGPAGAIGQEPLWFNWQSPWPASDITVGFGLVFMPDMFNRKPEIGEKFSGFFTSAPENAENYVIYVTGFIEQENTLRVETVNNVTAQSVTMDQVNEAISAAITGAMEEAY